MEFVGFAVLIIDVLLMLLYGKDDEVKKAKKAYEASLDNLRNNPNDPDLRQQTLELGRYYSNLSRNLQGVTRSDEVSIKNDIDAATAGSVTLSHNRTNSGQVATSGTATPSERLRQLEQIRLNDLISDEEYQSHRARILADL